MKPALEISSALWQLIGIRRSAAISRATCLIRANRSSHLSVGLNGLATKQVIEVMAVSSLRGGSSRRVSKGHIELGMGSLLIARGDGLQARPHPRPVLYLLIPRADRGPPPGVPAAACPAPPPSAPPPPGPQPSAGDWPWPGRDRSRRPSGDPGGASRTPGRLAQEPQKAERSVWALGVGHEASPRGHSRGCQGGQGAGGVAGLQGAISNRVGATQSRLSDGAEG